MKILTTRVRGLISLFNRSIEWGPWSTLRRGPSTEGENGPERSFEPDTSIRLPPVN